MSQPENRFERHKALTLSLTILFVLIVVDLISLALLQMDRFESDAKALELADYRRYDAWTLFQNRPDQSMRFDFKGVVADAEFELDQFGFVTTENQPESPRESIVLLGGSTVFGVGASSYRTTIASRLQALLNERAPGRYVVHNAGVRGYHSLQEFVFYVNDVARQIDPSIVISLNGRNDDHLMRKAFARGNFDTDYSDQLDESVSKMIDQGFDPTFLEALGGVARATHFGRLIKAIANPSSKQDGNVMDRLAAFGLPPDEALFEGPANGYAAVMNALSAAVSTSGSRHIWALQPTIFEKSFATDEEKTRVEKIARIDPEMFDVHRSYHDAFYDVAREEDLLDLSRIFDEEKRSIFIDDCHYNDLGNELIANQLLAAVLGSRPVQP